MLLHLLAIVRLASSAPVIPLFHPEIPPLPFPPQEDISSCHFTPTAQSPTQPWHGASLYPSKLDGKNPFDLNLTLPSSPQTLDPVALLTSTTKRAPHPSNSTATNPPICATIAAFTFTNWHSYLADTKPLTLPKGTYILSFTTNIPLQGIIGMIDPPTAHPGGGHPRQFFDAERGTLLVVLEAEAVVWWRLFWRFGMFELGMRGEGEVALFRVGF